MGIPIQRYTSNHNIASRLVEMCLYYRQLTSFESQIQWAISMAELRFIILQMDQPVLMLADSDVISTATPGMRGLITVAFREEQSIDHL